VEAQGFSPAKERRCGAPSFALVHPQHVVEFGPIAAPNSSLVCDNRDVRLLLSLALAVTHCVFVSSTVQAQAVGKITGAVYFNGSEMPGFPVTLYSSDQVVEIEADSAGHFEFTNLPPGTYDLQAKYGGAEAHIYAVRIEGKDVGPLTLDAKLVEFPYDLAGNCGRKYWISYNPDPAASGRVSGTLLLYPTVSAPSALFKNAGIRLIAAGGSHHSISQHPDENGKFEFRDIPPGRYSLLASSRGYWKVQTTIWVARKDVTAVKIVLYEHGHPAICE